ncbi:DNA replication initiation factor cdc45 [Colletotrichum truncatum]|uniref:DNA replication initiation factor cdc45 n=1 Tax=Colletotrichum truncatum TaxID=5467 RepID=A0ACC3ZKH2_COLTU|nr:DNA replication initiation factor cdc45 [Colletotrichum truncatum]KAF6799974.1 DNA replication initiation factor cdc45 [Colletotrichum truncatum]
MGIPHLVNYLAPYGVLGPLDGDRVVIDGPALAYHIYHLCTRSSIGLPSYELLGDTTIAWLEKLTSHDISIGAIYFDGFLPPAKLPVRLERLLRVSTQLKLFHSAFPNACPSKQVAATHPKRPRLFPTDAPRRDQPLTPPPPFLVAAVVDKLNQEEKYANLVRLVPGEADAYCADDVMKNGGTILTSDSDLTIHDLNEGSVAFLKDLHIGSTDGKDGLLGLKFSPSDVEKRLNLPDGQGMRRFGYELSKSSRPKFAQVLENCKGDVSDLEDFRRFCEPYETLETTDWSAVPVLGSLQSPKLDARLSEFILQCVGYSGAAKSSPQESGGDGCMMCLPPLLDCPARASAWDSSASVRQLAYSLASLLQPRTSPPVREYRRVYNGTNQGKHIIILPRPSIKDYADFLLETLSQAKEGLGEHDSMWQTIALQQILSQFQSDGKQEACVSAIKQALSVEAGSSLVPWDVVHLSAQVQATLYSLRILAQVLDLLKAIKAESVPDGLDEIRELLATLPPLTEWPNVDGTMALLTDLRTNGGLAKLGEVLEIPESDFLPSKEAKSRKKKRKKTAEVEVQVRPEKKASSNPFDILGDE